MLGSGELNLTFNVQSSSILLPTLEFYFVAHQL